MDRARLILMMVVAQRMALVLARLRGNLGLERRRRTTALDREHRPMPMTTGVLALKHPDTVDLLRRPVLVEVIPGATHLAPAVRQMLTMRPLLVCSARQPLLPLMHLLRVPMPHRHPRQSARLRPAAHGLAADGLTQRPHLLEHPLQVRADTPVAEGIMVRLRLGPTVVRRRRRRLVGRGTLMMMTEVERVALWLESNS